MSGLEIISLSVSGFDNPLRKLSQEVCQMRRCRATKTSAPEAENLQKLFGGWVMKQRHRGRRLKSRPNEPWRGGIGRVQ